MAAAAVGVHALMSPPQCHELQLRDLAASLLGHRRWWCHLVLGLVDVVLDDPTGLPC